MGRMRMHPYVRKPWQAKSRKRLLASFSLSLIIGGGFSYFLMQVLFLELSGAALCGVALSMTIFLISNCCACFKASHVQDLNKTIASVATDFVHEVDQIALKMH
mmetsp:Transcript_44955/g.59657  ORF Transcript_44955/g.59657 Transcript_44955/m.59657 type:complete len:104 (+) Transcript_44955:224-535(+)